MQSSRHDQNRRHVPADLRIPEYWIVDPLASKTTVLKFDRDGYTEHGVFGPGDVASSALLGDFELPASKVFNASDFG